MGLFLTNYKLVAEIGVSNVGGTWTYAPLAEGIDNLVETLNEIVQEYQFLSDKGFGQGHVTGMHPKWTFSGRRILGDAAQDYIAGVKYKLDTARESSFRISYVDASQPTNSTPLITVACTLTNIQDIAGGASTDDSVFSVDVSFKGAPVLGDAVPLQPLTVVSVAGSSSGDTAIYVNPILSGGNSYKYSIGTAPNLPNSGTTVSEGWTAWNGTDEITATTGQYISLIEVNSSGAAVAGGSAIVTSM